uniref:Uncharacterized protein n=1 Tax=Oryza meridionalis TaxID=40149 RepID=A0A0E0DQF9_9ORYZ
MVEGAKGAGNPVLTSSVTTPSTHLLLRRRIPHLLVGFVAKNRRRMGKGASQLSSCSSFVFACNHAKPLQPGRG